MLPLVLLTALAAAPKLAAPGLTCAGIPPGTCNAFSEHLAQQLTDKTLSVSTASDIEAVLGQERQKQLLGCDDNSSSCSLEIANVLGVDAILRGSLAKVGQTVIVNIRVISASNAKTLATYSETAQGLEMVPEALEHAAVRIASELNLETCAGTGSRWATPKVLVPAGVAVAAAAGGVATLLMASGQASQLTGRVPPEFDPYATRDQANTLSTTSYVLFGIAGAAAVTAGVFYFWGGSSSAASSEPLPATMAIGPSGAFISFTGVWP